MGASRPAVGLIIVAAGSSTRMAGTDKVRALLNGISVVAHSIRNLAAHTDATVVVAGPRGLPEDALASLVSSGSRWRVVDRAGEDRQGSVRLGLEALEDDVQIVAVHDAARPLASHALLLEGIRCLQHWDGAIPGVPVTDTIKRVDGNELVRGTVNRAQLRAVQTPQVFRGEALREAHRSGAAVVGGATDDSSLLERIGRTVGVFPGAPRNIKITTALDLQLATWLLRRETFV